MYWYVCISVLPIFSTGEGRGEKKKKKEEKKTLTVKNGTVNIIIGRLSIIDSVVVPGRYKP